jgi:murein DD-endopeptidase MepM/ murein hydrolase activator NlpD
MLLLSAAVTVTVPLGLGLAPIRDGLGSQRRPEPTTTVPFVLISAVDAPLPPAPVPLPPPPSPRDPANFVNPIEGKVISPYGYRDGERHDGIDLKGVDRAAVSASFPGRVIQAGQGASGYGLSVTIDHGDGVVTLYAHLAVAISRVGDVVVAGQQIGVQGQTGRATTSHLHYEVHVDGRVVSPVPYLAR